MLLSRIGHMLSCKQASHLISLDQDADLPVVKGWLLRLHLAACDGCTRFNTQMQVLREAMRRYRS
jgi:hypothetical protein